jgi:hypothetical protein
MRRVLTAVRRAAVFVDHWQWLVLLLAAPLLAFPTPARSPILLVVPGLWIIAGLAGEDCLPRTPLNGSLLVLAVMMLVSLYATYSIAASLPAIAGVVLGIGVFYSVTRMGQYTRGWWMSFIVFAGLGTGIAGLSLFGTRWIAKIALLTPIVRSLPPILIGLPGIDDGLHPNEVAGALLWVMPALIIVSVWLLTRVKTWWAPHRQVKAFALIGLVIAATLLVAGTFVLTQSRGGYLAVALSGVVLALVALPKHRSQLLPGILVALAITIGVGYLFFKSDPTSNEPIGESIATNSALSLDTLEGRLEVWSRALYAIQDFPLTGMGMNTFQHIAPVLYPLFLISPDYNIGHAHNEFLQTALDLGLPGLIAILGLYIIAFWMLRMTWNEVGHSDVGLSILGAGLSAQSTRAMAHAIVLGLTGGLLAHLFFGLTDAVPIGSKYGILFWMLLGLITALFLQTQAVTPARPQA